MENKATFQFRNFRVERSLIELNLENGDSFDTDLKLDIKAKGILSLTEKTFTLTVFLSMDNKDSSVKIDLVGIGSFAFLDAEDTSLDAFIMNNAPAIMFPYMRAYLTALTALSGIEPIILPTMNLSNMIQDHLTIERI